jgi:ubiquitin carboxyl-terminal hydrolase 9/24
MSNPNKGKWYRFNDTSVEEFEMTEESLESECFGGKYKAKVFDNGMYCFSFFFYSCV